MPSFDLLIPFFVASAIFACTPGPGMLYAAAQTMASGRRAGWHAAIGFHLAGFVHIAMAATGVSILLDAIPLLFVGVKIVGAGYLVWLGSRYLSIRTPVRPPTANGGAPTNNAATTLKDSMVVEVLNPKSALFHWAFLPQFTDVAAALPVWAQVVVLGMIVNAMFTITDIVLIEVADSAATRLRTCERMTLALRRAGGGILIAMGVNLALVRQ